MTYTHRHQHGIATLSVTVILLLVTTIMMIAASRVGILDLRMSANQTRHKEAFAIAEAGLDFTAERFGNAFRLNSDPIANIATIVANSQVAANTEIDGTSPEAGDPYFTASVADTGVSIGGVSIYVITATGVGADGTGTATVQRQFTMTHVFGGDVPDVPIIVGGAVGTGGNFNVVANPNSSGNGIPVSIWSSGDITATSSSATCHLQYYDGNNAQCSNPSGNVENISRGSNPATAITSHDADYPDLLPNDPNFPPDLFNFMFGQPRANWETKRDEAARYGQVVSSCADIVAAGANAGQNFPLWWVTGDCSISGGPTLGGTTTSQPPVIIVIDDHTLSITGGAQINGIVYLFDNPDDPYADQTSPDASLGGTTEIAGSFVSDVGGSAMSGSYAVKYDPNLISLFENNGSNYSFAWIPASWRDFQ